MSDMQVDAIAIPFGAAGADAEAPMTLSMAQRAAYDRDGFLALPMIATPADVARVREIYDALFLKRCGWETGDFFETSGDFEEATPILPQMNWLSRYEPSLLESSFHRNALAIARELLGPKAELVWEFAMMKPAFTGGETPAHQDEASFTKGTDYDHAISFWMPLQDVDRRNGCMEYAPGSHLGPLHPHQSIGGDPLAHGLEVLIEERPAFTAVPLRAGDAVIHQSRTLHCAGANRSPVPRRAYILEFAVHSNSHLMLKDYPWNQSKRTARQARQRRSMSFKQVMIERLRWFKKSVARSLARRSSRRA